MKFNVKKLCKMADFARKDATIIPSHLSGKIPERILNKIKELEGFLDMGENIFSQQEKKQFKSEIQCLKDALSIYQTSS